MSRPTVSLLFLSLSLSPMPWPNELGCCDVWVACVLPPCGCVCRCAWFVGVWWFVVVCVLLEIGLFGLVDSE
jgi:hypothetical protein